mgnify:CR=1 FL=1|jgi:hypothetical protein|tara:strand:- start:803 stop:1342 length:540 start_codon:yes stop_codon:yes gene_type:complete
MAGTSAVDLFVVYQFIKRIATPFAKWEGYKAGVIDDRGNIKVKPKDRDQTQKNSFKTFDVMVLKLKRLLEKIPGGKTRIASYAAALWLIKEDWETRSEEQILSEGNDSYIEYLRLYKLENYNKMLEDAPTNAIGSGAIAGGGYNGIDDVKVSKKKKKNYKVMNKIDAAAMNAKFATMFR